MQIFRPHNFFCTFLIILISQIFCPVLYADETTQEKTFRDSANEMRFFSYGDEIFLASNYVDGSGVYVSADKKNAVRRFYDEMHRLQKSEKWKIADGSFDAVIAETVEYVYDGDSLLPSASLTVAGDIFTEAVFDKFGNTSVMRVSKKTEDGKKKLQRVSTWTYSDDEKLVETTYKKMTDDGVSVSYETKETYKYHVKSDEDVPPDYDFYENGILRTSTVYKSHDTYITVHYFDDGFEVSEAFKNGKKISEVFAKSGKILREQKYAQEFD